MAPGLGCRCEPRLRGRLGLLDGSVVRRRQLPRRGRRGLRRGLRHRHRWASKVRCAAGLASPNRAHRLRRHPVPYVYRGGHRQLSRTRRRLGPGGAAPAGVPFGRRHHAPGAHDVPAKAPHSSTLVGPEGAPSLRVEAHAQEVACRVGSSNDPILCRSWCLVKDRISLARAGAARREARQVRELHRVVVRRLLLFLVLLVVLVGVVFLRRPFIGRLSRASSLTASSMPRALESRGGAGGLTRVPSLPLAFAGRAAVLFLRGCATARGHYRPIFSVEVLEEERHRPEFQPVLGLHLPCPSHSRASTTRRPRASGPSKGSPGVCLRGGMAKAGRGP